MAAVLPDDGPARPPLKWAGGKRWLLPELQTLWQPYRHWRLVEPFCGGLGVALGLAPAAALLNDINPHAVNFYRWLQRGLRIRIPADNDAEVYYAHRAEFNRLIGYGKADSRRAAELFYYLNRTGYNGLCRFNQSGKFNVPFGRRATTGVQRDLSAYARRLAGWELTCGDFATLALRADDFVYADPPYDVQFRQYSSDGFAWTQQERLAHWLAGHTGPVVASNQATPRVLDLYRGLGFSIRLLNGPRRISCTGDREPATEMLAWRGRESPGAGASRKRQSV